MKQYKVTHVPHFIGGRICQIGEVVTLPAGVKPGRWLVEVGGKPEPAADQTPSGYRPQHKGAGKFVVVDESGSQVGDFSGNRDEAIAEADRLNHTDLAGNLPDA